MGKITIMYVTLVILIYGSIATGVVYFAVKKTRLFMILLGVAAILGAVPVGFLAEIGINGCCGAPSMGNEGLGFVIGILIGIVGISLILLGSRYKKKKPEK